MRDATADGMSWFAQPKTSREMAPKAVPPKATPLPPGALPFDAAAAMAAVKAFPPKRQTQPPQLVKAPPTPGWQPPLAAQAKGHHVQPTAQVVMPQAGARGHAPLGAKVDQPAQVASADHFNEAATDKETENEDEAESVVASLEAPRPVQDPAPRAAGKSMSVVNVPVGSARQAELKKEHLMKLGEARASTPGQLDEPPKEPGKSRLAKQSAVAQGWASTVPKLEKGKLTHPSLVPSTEEATLQMWAAQMAALAAYGAATAKGESDMVGSPSPLAQATERAAILCSKAFTPAETVHLTGLAAVALILAAEATAPKLEKSTYAEAETEPLPQEGEGQVVSQKTATGLMMEKGPLGKLFPGQSEAPAPEQEGEQYTALSLKLQPASTAPPRLFEQLATAEFKVTGKNEAACAALSLVLETDVLMAAGSRPYRNPSMASKKPRAPGLGWAKPALSDIIESHVKPASQRPTALVSLLTDVAAVAAEALESTPESMGEKAKDATHALYATRSGILAQVMEKASKLLKGKVTVTIQHAQLMHIITAVQSPHALFLLDAWTRCQWREC